MKKIYFLACLALLLNACNDENPSQQTQMGVQDVEAVRVSPENIPLSFEYAARAQGSKETEVRARVGGILLKRNYTEGSRVEEGTVLFQIDPEPFKVTLNQAKAKLAQTKAQLQAAESQWKRIEKLFVQKVVSEKSRDDAKANLDALRASAQLAQAEVDSAQLNLDYTTVKAPISGVTSLEAQSEGSLIAVNGLLTNITQLDPIYVIFSATENEIASLTDMVDRGLVLTPNSKKDIRAKLKLGNDSFYPEEGEINFITPNIDESTGTVKLRAVFPNAEGRLRPGQFLRLVMEGLVRKDALVLPQSAVMQNPSGSYVYRVDKEGKVESVMVKTGLSTPNGDWIIDEGLKPGDVVLTSGLLKLRPGMPVNPVLAPATK